MKWLRATTIVGLGLALASTVTIGTNAYAKDTTITYAIWAVKEVIDELTKQIVPRFESLNPGIKVKILNLEFNPYIDKMLAGVAAGSAPDIIHVEEGIITPFAANDIFLNLGPYAKRDKLDLSNLMPSIKRNMLWKGDTFIALPVHTYVNVMYYNRDLFRQSGVETPKLGWTWDDFLAICKKITKDANNDGKPEIWGVHMWWGEATWGPFLWMNGGGFLDKPVLGTKSIVGSPESIEGFSFYNDLFNKYKVGLGGFYTESIFTGGKCGMLANGSWAVPSLRTAKKLDFDAAPFPSSPQTKQSSSRLVTGSMGIWKGSKNKEAAWKFMKFNLSEFAQRRKHTTSCFAPLSPDQVDWPEFYPPDQRPPSGRMAFAEQMKSAQPETVYPTGTFFPEINRVLQKVLANKAEPQVAMRALDKTLTSMLAQVKGRFAR